MDENGLHVCRNDLDSVVGILTGVLAVCVHSLRPEVSGERKRQLLVHLFKPFDDDAPEDPQRAPLQFQEVGTRVFDGHRRILGEANGSGHSPAGGHQGYGGMALVTVGLGQESP